MVFMPEMEGQSRRGAYLLWIKPAPPVAEMLEAKAGEG
jgi:hypothetical protein